MKRRGSPGTQGLGVLSLVPRHRSYAQGWRGLWMLTASTEEGTSVPRPQGAGLHLPPPKFRGGSSQEPPDEAYSLADCLISAF